MLVFLSVWSEVQTCIWPSWCYCHSLSLASVKSRLVLPFWYRLTRVVPKEGPLNVCSSQQAGQRMPLPKWQWTHTHTHMHRQTDNQKLMSLVPSTKRVEAIITDEWNQAAYNEISEQVEVKSLTTWLQKYPNKYATTPYSKWSVRFNTNVKLMLRRKAPAFCDRHWRHSTICITSPSLLLPRSHEVFIAILVTGKNWVKEWKMPPADQIQRSVSWQRPTQPGQRLSSHWTITANIAANRRRSFSAKANHN